MRKERCCREECQHRDVEVTSGMGIALEYLIERWKNSMEASHCCLIRMRMSWGGNCLLEIFSLFHFPQPSSVVENLKFINWFLGKCSLKTQKLFTFFSAFFLSLQGCRLFPLPGFIHFFWMLFSSAGLSHSPAKVFTLLGFTWIQLSWISQLLESQNGRIKNKRKNPNVVLSHYFNKEKKNRSTGYLKE